MSCELFAKMLGYCSFSMKGTFIDFSMNESQWLHCGEVLSDVSTLVMSGDQLSNDGWVETQSTLKAIFFFSFLFN